MHTYVEQHDISILLVNLARFADYDCRCLSAYTGKNCESAVAYESTLVSGGRKFQISSVTANPRNNATLATPWDEVSERSRTDWVWNIVLERYPNFYYNREFNLTFTLFV